MLGKRRCALLELSAEQEAEALARRAEGWSFDRIASALGVSVTPVRRHLSTVALLPKRHGGSGPNRKRAALSGVVTRRLAEQSHGDAR